jgi:hypothetical protein|tara:strand:+ start:2011 stop:2433 length:423 start_codon:yes stop_codon:yes gene_type:complete
MSKTHCKWIEDDEQMLVSPDGQVLPCCYLSNYYAADQLPLIRPDIVKGKPFNVMKNIILSTKPFDNVEDQLYHIPLVNHLTHTSYLHEEYNKRKDKLNIFTNDLGDILSNEWFTKILPESWEDPKKIAGPCKEICTKCDE